MGSATEVDGAPNRVQRPRVPDASPPPPSGLRRVVLVVTGVVALALGVLGVALPLLPATPFVLLAAACFAGAWPTMHARLTRSRLFGPMLRAGPGERYLPRATKIGVLVFAWLSIGATAVFVAHTAWLRALLGILVLVLTWVLGRMPTQPPDRP